MELFHSVGMEGKVQGSEFKVSIAFDKIFCKYGLG
jgi:hypothetical protein|tara:strand:+ start:41 stop:145 length:105 start_codon:yes stop_codon:yes gene_type:complete